MKNLLTIFFAIFALIFVACEDKDVTPDDKTPTAEVCDPVCNVDTETCICRDTNSGDHACTCEAKATEECKCDDGSDCPNDEKDACSKHEDAKCDSTCTEDKECKCEANKCECVTKPVEDKCAGKAENDECDANKTCQKGKDDKLECKDKLAE